MDDHVCVDLNKNTINSFDGDILSYIYQHQDQFAWIAEVEKDSLEKARDILYMSTPDRPSLSYGNDESILDDMSIEGDDFLELSGFWNSDAGKLFSSSLSELNYHEQSRAIRDKINTEMKDKFISWKKDKLSQEENNEHWKYEPKEWEVVELSVKLAKPIVENAAYESGLMVSEIKSNKILCYLSPKQVKSAKKFFTHLMSGTVSTKGNHTIDGSYSIVFHNIHNNMLEEVSLSKL